MDRKWSLRSKDKENGTRSKDPIVPPVTEKEAVMSFTDEYRVSLKKQMEKEVEVILDEEIRKAAQELIQEQWRAIRETAEEHKQIIREVVAEEKLAFQARVEEFKRSIATLGMG